MAEDVVRPICRCHGVAQIKDGRHPSGGQKWQCAVKERARQAELYADPEFAAKKKAGFRERWGRMSHAERSAANLRNYLYQLNRRVDRIEAAS